MTVFVTASVCDGMKKEADEAFPRECCGLLFGSDGVIHTHQLTANVHPQPTKHFEIDPQALIDAHRATRAGGPRLVGYYHSHPNGPPEPSATDRALAAPDGMLWAIVAQGELRLWRSGENGFSALSYTRV